VIIADQRIIIEQIKERLELRDVIDEVGLFYGGTTPKGQSIVVGSIQSLATPPASLQRKDPAIYAKRKKRSKQFQAITKKADLLMVDECDKATSKQYRNLFRFHFNGRRKYGFSGTPFDKKKPVDGLILRENLGSIISTTERKELEGIGRIIPIKFYMFAYGEDGDPQDKTAFDIAEREIIIDNDKFHKRILKIVQAFPNDGTLILIDTSNIEDLGLRLEQLIPNSAFIYGKTPKTKRRAHIKSFENRELKCLIGGKIIKRGLDLSGGVENLIIIGGGKLWSEFDQKLGRAVRNNQRGWARVFSFLFLNNYYLYRHSREQLKALVSLGYTSQVIFKHYKLDGEKFVKSRFRRPKPTKHPS
jgi:superfamily II DNA or RNA helicase